MAPYLRMSPFMDVAGAVDDFHGNGLFRGFFQEMGSFRFNECDFVARTIEADVAAGDIVGDDHIALFSFQFTPGIGFHIVGFRSEPDESSPESENIAHGAENVRRTFQFQHHAVGRFFDFLRCDGDGTVIRNGGTENGDVGLVAVIGYGIVHFLAGFHREEVDPMRNIQRCGARDEENLVAVVDGSFRKAVPHSAGGTVADEAGRIDGFPRGAGCDEKSHSWLHYGTFFPEGKPGCALDSSWRGWFQYRGDLLG